MLWKAQHDELLLFVVIVSYDFPAKDWVNVARWYIDHTYNNTPWYVLYLLMKKTRIKDIEK